MPHRTHTHRHRTTTRKRLTTTTLCILEATTAIAKCDGVCVCVCLFWNQKIRNRMYNLFKSQQFTYEWNMWTKQTQHTRNKRWEEKTEPNSNNNNSTTKYRMNVRAQMRCMQQYVYACAAYIETLSTMCRKIVRWNNNNNINNNCTVSFAYLK